MSKHFVRYALREVLLLAPLFVVASVLLFWLIMEAPGDPINVLVGPSASEETIQRVRHEFGLDRPLPVQYFDFMKDFLRGDFGESIKYRDRGVMELFWERFQISAPLGFAAFMISTILGTTIGLIATFNKGSLLDKFLLSTAVFFSAIPALLMIQFLILFLSLRLGWLPAGWSGGWDAIFSTTAVIPVLTLSLVGVAGFARFIRTTTITIIDEPYILAAKARGVGPNKIATGYVLRNASLPLLTVIVPSIFTFWEGSFFVERIYGIPGLGVFMIESLFARDYAVLLSLGLLFVTFGYVTILIVDLLYHFADPRVNLSK